MTKQLLNLNTIQKITLILTTLLLLPMSSWAASFFTSGNISGSNNSYTWTYGGTKSWTITTTSGATLDLTNAANLSATITNGGNITLSTTRPVDNNCKLSGIRLSAQSNTPFENCSIILKFQGSNDQYTLNIDNDFGDRYYNFETPQEWAEGKSIEVIICQTNSQSSASCNISKITIDIQELSDANFEWPTDLTSEDDISGIQRTEPNGVLLEGHCMKNTMFSFALQPQTTMTNQPEITYTSTKTEVATVDESGKVTVIGKGQTTIKATIKETSSFYFDPAEHSYTLNITELDEDYGLTVGGVKVTSNNASNVFGDGKVSFDAGESILTLNNANIEPEVEAYGIEYTQNSNLTIKLIGTNTIKGKDGCEPFIYNVANLTNAPKIIFINGGNQPCSIQIDADENKDAFKYFSGIEYDGLFMINDYILGSDAPNINRTTITSTILGGGNGTAANPFLIKEPTDLINFAKYINNKTINSDVSVQLYNDINCQGLQGFEPIGNYSINFSGTFDGNEKTISNLSANNVQLGAVGLFAILASGGKIENLTLSNCTFYGGNSSSNDIGSLVGYMNGGEINNCAIENSTISSLQNTQNPTVGGIVGSLNNGSNINNCIIQDCSIKAETNDKSASGANAKAGGIVGTITGGSISGCQVKGRTTVSADYGNYSAELSAGAIIAYNSAGSLSNNTYEYTVTTSTNDYNYDNETATLTTKSGYEQRGTGTEMVVSDVSYYDVFENNGAVLANTKKLTLPPSQENTGFINLTSGYYKMEESDYYVAADQKVEILVTPRGTNTTGSFTVTNTSNNTTIETTTKSTSDGTTYSFTMPNSDVTVSVAFGIDIANAQFTEATIEDAAYDGTEQVPTTVTLTSQEGGKINLKNNSDGTQFIIKSYKLNGETVSSPINVGTYTVTIEGTGDYAGTREVQYTITKGYAGIMFYRMVDGQAEDVHTVQNATYGVTYDAPLFRNPNNLNVTFYSKESNGLEGNNSEAVTIDENGNITINEAGTAYIFATTPGNDNYEEKTVSYKLIVAPSDLSSVTIAEISNQTYTGSDIEPAVTVTLNGKSVSTDDYDIAYSNNIDVSTDNKKATIILTAKSTSTRFAANTTKTATFSIVAKSLSEATMTLSETEYTYDGNAKNPSVTIKFESDGATGADGTTGSATTLTEGTDYDVTYKKVNGESEDDIAANQIITAGTYKAIATAKGNYTGSKEATFSITKTSITPTVTLEGWTYGTTAKTPTISGNTGNGSVTYEYKLKTAEDSEYKADAPTEAGEYTIKATIAATANYEAATATTDFTISKADITPTVTLEGWTYGATANTPTITGNTGEGTVTYTYKAEGAESFVETAPEAAGNYTIKASIAETTNYNSGEATTEFTITAATMDVTAEGYKGTYDNEAHEITIKAPEGAVVKYRNQEGTYTLTEAPTYTNAGTYEVHYQVTMDNYNTFTGSATVDISKADITPTVSLEGWTYGTTAKSPSVTGNTGEGTVTYTYQAEGAETFGETAPEIVGTHTIKALIAETTNYNAGEATATFTITAATMTVTAKGYEGTYDTQAHGIKVTAPEDATVNYGSQEGTYNLQNSPTYTDAGTYTVYYQVTMSNYTTVTGSKTVEISKANITPTVALEGWTYGTTANTPSITGNTGNGNVTYTYKAEGSETFVDTKPEVVGTHTIKASIAETTNYNAGEATAEFTITAATSSVTAKGYKGAFNNEAHGITVTAPEGSIVMYGTQEGTYELSESPTYINAGNYTVYYQVTKENYTTVTGSVTIEISKADITPTVTLEGWTYGTTAKTPSITGNTGEGTVTYTYKAEGADAFGETAPEVVGTHTVKASIAETTNYNAGEATATFTITAATMTVTVSGHEGTYDNKAHGITVTAPEGSKVMYGSQNGTYNLTEAPTYTDAGTYEVYYQVTMDNYTTVTGSETVNISKAAITPTVTLEGWTYGTTAKTPSITGNTGEGTVTYTYKAEGAETFTGTMPEVVGTHTIKASIAETTNYNAGEATTTFTITAATMTITAAGHEGTYDGKAHGITVTAPEDATIKYGEQEGSYEQSEAPTYTDAGTYEVYYQVTMDNYTTVTGSATVEISKADITPTVTLEGWTYGATANTPTITGNTGNGTVTYTYKAEGAETFVETAPETAGNYTIKASIAETANYNAGEATTEFTITAATMNITAEGYEGTYDTQAHGITIKAPEGAVVKYRNQEGTYTLTEAPTYTNAGTYEVHYQVTMDNYTTVTSSATVKISKADITPTVSLEGWTYGTTAKSPSVTGNTGEGTVTYTYQAEGAEIFTETMPEVVGTHTIKASIAETTNYNAGEATATFTITAATMIVTAKGYEGTYDGNAHGITVTAPEDATIKYGTAEGSYELNASPEYTAGGNYTVYYQVTMDNYATVTGSETVKISKAEAELEFDVPEESKVYATIGEEFTEPTLNNLKGLDVTFSSSDESVATVDKTTGKVTLKSAGLTYITATFAGNDNYNEFAVKYELRVKGSYNLWIDNVQVTSDNYNDILENQKFFYDLVNKWLIITNNETPVTVKSSMPELTIYLNGKSDLERIYFDNQGNAQNTGTLSFFNYNDVPGKLTLDTNNDNGVISGFSSISFDDNTKLRFIDPDSCEYKDGLVKMTKPSQLGEIVKQVTIGQYIEPMANGDGISFGNIDSETNITNMTIEDKLLITATQHEEGSNEDDDYIDPNNGAFVMNTTNTSEDVEVLSQGVESGNKQPGSEDYADSFRGGITFMVPSGTGTIELELMNEEGYMLMLKIGTGVPHEIVRYERATVVIDYNVDEPTYVYLYLEEKSIIGARRAGNNTRVGKRDKAHGTVFSVKVKAASVSSTNPLNNVEGATGNITIPDVNTTTPSGDDVPTKAEFKITNDENKANDDKWYTINGQRINKPTQKGVYIRNRKKVVVK